MYRLVWELDAKPERVADFEMVYGAQGRWDSFFRLSPDYLGSELYKSTGTVQQGIMEVGQVRMGANATPWTQHDLYESQSPIHQAEKIKTPFLILHGTADGAVDWHQGLEYYNAARRLGKQVILLSYPDEPHHLAKNETQQDFQIRMKQFFDHYLKETAAPKWMIDGVPFLQKGKEKPAVSTTSN